MQYSYSSGTKSATGKSSNSCYRHYTAWGIKVSKNNNIAVIATPATVKMNVYKTTFDLYAPQGSTIIQRGCKLLCPMIERRWGRIHGDYLTDELIRLYLEALPKEIDTLILGCTHYPLIRDKISKYFKKNIVDPAVETTEDLLRELGRIKIKNGEVNMEKIDFIVSGKKEFFIDLAETFLEERIDNIRTLKLM
ncbi:glutamate racemase [Propionigenium maris]|nr:hypothetical protein [Propionigenium maris]